MKLYIDDLRNPPDSTWVVARTFDDAKKKLLEAYPTITAIAFDHDLGDADDRKNGYELMCVFETLVKSNKIDHPVYLYIHTSNPSGFKKMQLASDSIYRNFPKVKPHDYP